MELVLNIFWLLLSIALLALWIRHSRKHSCCRGIDRHLQFVALAIVLLLLFPVISVSDDLLIAQNPAEMDTCIQKNCNCSVHHQHLPAMALLPEHSFLVVSFDRASLVQRSKLLDRSTQNPALRRVENRPPPAIV